MQIAKIEILELETGTTMRPVGCRVHANTGVYGDGEATMSYGAAAEGVAGQLIELARIAVGHNPLEHEKIWSMMQRDSIWGLNGGATIFTAMSAIDIALWDLKGKHFGVPVHVLLGGKKRSSVRCYASQIQNGWSPEKLKGLSRYMCKSAEDFAEAAQHAVAAGFDAVKVDVVIDGEVDDRLGMANQNWLGHLSERVAAIRQAVGPKIDIILENHAHTSANTGAAIARVVEKFGIFYLEEPCEPEVSAMRVMARSTNIPLATGERVYGRHGFLPFFEQGLIQIAQPDVGNCGGITEAKKICDLAETYSVGVQLHNCHSDISNAATLHLESTLSNFVIHEHAGHNLWRPTSFDQYCTRRLVPNRGRIKIPDEPGLGVEWNEKSIETAKTVTITV